ncbi:MAG: ArnT family glycosyltransferase [Myxococcota bacterium]
MPAASAPAEVRFWRHPGIWLVLLSALLIRLPGLTAPYVERFVWRSIDNAAIARNFWQVSMNLLYPRVDWAGPEGYVETDLPLLMWVAGWLYSLLGQEDAWVGRGLTLLCFMLALGLFACLAHAWVGRRGACVATGFLAFTPTSIFFSRLFQQDALMLAAQMGALLCAWHWLSPAEHATHNTSQPPSPRSWLWGSGVMGCLALGALVKPTALLIGLPIAELAFYRNGWRAVLQLPLYGVAAGALLLPLSWYLHAQQTYLTYGFTFGIFGGGHDKFQWCRFLSQREWYRELIKRFFTWHLTTPGVLLCLLGLLALVRWRSPARVILLSWMLTMLLFIPLVAEGNYDMLYYQWVSIPPLAMLVGVLFRAESVREPEAYPVRSNTGLRRLQLFGMGLLLLVPLHAYLVVRPAYEVHQGKNLALAEAIKTHVPPGALLVDALAYDWHNPGGYNFEPMQFYYSGHKGWGMVEEDLTLTGVEVFRAKGAQFLVSWRTQALQEKASFWIPLTGHYPLILDTAEAVIVDLRQPLQP